LATKPTEQVIISKREQKPLPKPKPPNQTLRLSVMNHLKNTDNSEVNTEMTQEERAKWFIYREMLDTERAYQKDMELLLSVLDQMKEIRALPEEEYNLLYRNYGIILAISLQLEKTFEKHKGDIVKAFGEKIDLLHHYQPIILYHQDAIQTLRKLIKKEKKMQKFLEKIAEHGTLRNLQLEDFLIKPFQRICKYPLFFEQLLKESGENRTERNAILQVQKRLKEVVQAINEEKAKKEFGNVVAEKAHQDPHVIVKKQQQRLSVPSEGPFALPTFNHVIGELKQQNVVHQN